MAKKQSNSSGRTMSRAGRLDIKRIAHERSGFRDLYHFLMKISWPRLLLFFTTKYLLINLAFASAYYVGGDVLRGATGPLTFLDCFFFSIQTFSTIGYGSLSPVGLYANMLVTLEALVGMLAVSVTTGLIFAKFSRPTARIQFSDNMVIRPFDGKPTLMLRIANLRQNQIIEARAHLTFIRTMINEEGEQMRRFFDLDLVRAASPLLSISWTLMHVIDESSPLFELSADELEQLDAYFIVTMFGMDETVAQDVHARTVYSYLDLLWNYRFLDMVLREEETSTMHIDFSRLSRVEPI
jgi:inward rectifier potassium channel